MAKTANVPDVEDIEEAVEKEPKTTLAASVSDRFRGGLDKFADDQGYTNSTLVRWLVEQDLGIAGDPPKKDNVSDKYLITTSVPVALADAFKDKAKASGETNANYLRKIVAKAIGYDLSQEPAVERGQWVAALRGKNEELANTQTKMFTRLYGMVQDGSMDKAVFEGMLADANKTYEDFGLAPV